VLGGKSILVLEAYYITKRLNLKAMKQGFTLIGLSFLTPTYTLTAVDGFSVDQKMDDGKPLTGKMLSFSLT
jgi:hypothetical protein